MEHSEPFLTNVEVQRRFQGGPQIGKSAVLVILDGRMYKREADGWHRLNNKPCATVEELVNVGST